MRSVDLGFAPNAFLQPDVHGEYALRFFQRHFQEKGLLSRGLPPVGVRIFVLSRFDSDAVTPAFTEVCRSPDMPETDRPLEFWLYNTTGEGIAGTHFDPILGSTSAAVSASSSNSSSSRPDGSPARRLRQKISHGAGSSSSLPQASHVEVVEVPSDEEQSGRSAPDTVGTVSADMACEDVSGAAEALPVRRSRRLAQRAASSADARARTGAPSRRK